MAQTRQLPLVIVLGATACGKSKLAIELAQKFCGQIVSADSMQVYHGLDIVTNKVTKEEQRQAKHHMIDYVDPLQRFSVIDFRNRSLDIIGNLLKSDSLPIVVGGTHYYIESLIWKSFIPNSPVTSTAMRSDYLNQNTMIDAESQLLHSLPKGSLHTDDDLESVEKFFKKPIYGQGFGHVESGELWKILEQVDPVSAHIFHHNDKRRIIRCLQIMQEKGKAYSDLLKDLNKSTEEGKSMLGGPLRFRPTCVLWLSCDKELLNQVLDERVDQMLNRGLLAELENFHADYNKQRLIDGEIPDYTKGIFQCIGFKEFHDYLMLDSEAKGTEKGNRILEKSIAKMKLSTRRYARRQLDWIRRRFLRAGTRDLPPIFKLTTSCNEEAWQRQVREPAFEIIESMMENRQMSERILEFKQEPEEQLQTNNPGKYYCEPCDRTFIGSHNIETHLDSRRHGKMRSRLGSKKQKVAE